MGSCHAERRVACPTEPLFDLIADIESYPHFVPGWRAAKILRRTQNHVVVRQTVSLAGMKVSFVSEAEVSRPHRLGIRSDTRPFRHFHLVWTLTEDGNSATHVRGDMDVAFRVPGLDLLSGRLQPRLLRRVVNAFEQEAGRRGLIEAGDHIGGG